MGYSISRLTLFALMSAIESDLREVIVKFLSAERKSSQLLGVELFEQVKQRADKDMRDISEDSSIELCLAYVDFSDSYKLLNSHKNLLPNDHKVYLQKITPFLEKLAPIRNRVMHSRPLQHEDLSITLDSCRDFVQEYPTDFWNTLNSTIVRLEQEPSFVLGLEIPTYFESLVNQNHNLPIPDFDETGFIGRSQIVKDIVKQCLGPYPVISIIGEGGLGKTALALKVAYEILDMHNNPFDAIVWSSSKTMQLTPTEIVRIEGAIFDSLGILNTVATNLAGNLYDNPIDEVLEYLEQFRILLILDNLETILDERIRHFLTRLPAGSKILITSRIGLGAFEIPIKLIPLDTVDSISLIRSLARIRGVSRLTQMNNQKLGGYCEQMHNNPGYIKWFVSAIQSGIRPEEALHNSEIFLEFCLSNVYEFLSGESKELLTAMMCVPGNHSQAELAFLTEMPIVELQKALQQLLTTNMVVMLSSPTGSSFTSNYELGDLPREYLQHHHSPSTDAHNKYTKRRKRLVASEEKARAEQRTKPYSPFSIVIRSTGDFVVARYLQSALYRTSEHRYRDADDEVKQAKSLAPEYFEVHRVDAWVKVAQKNITAAQTAYQSAVELESNHAPLLYWYGNFILRYLDDASSALEMLRSANKIDPDSFEIQFDMARANLYTMNYSEAQTILEAILENKGHRSSKDIQKVHDLYIQVFLRQADTQYQKKVYDEALEALEIMKGAFHKIPTNLVDAHIKDRLQKGMLIASQIVDSTYNETKIKAEEIKEWLYNVLSDQSVHSILRKGSFHGKILRIIPGEFFGFIRLDETGEQIFFHRNDLYDFAEWDELESDVRVAFSISENQKGPCAVGVRRSVVE